MQPGILIVKGLQQGLLIPLDHEVTTIGRDVKCSVQIDDATISRVHCRIYRRQIIPGEISYVLEDAGSFNGTLLNGIPVERAEISHGDQLSIGKTHLRFDEFSKKSVIEYSELNLADCPDIDHEFDTNVIDKKLEIDYEFSLDTCTDCRAGEGTNQQLNQIQRDLSFIHEVSVLVNRPLNRRLLFNEILGLILAWIKPEQGIAVLLNHDLTDLSDRIVKRKNSNSDESSLPAKYNRSLMTHVISNRIGVLKNFSVNEDDQSDSGKSTLVNVSAMCVPVMGSDRLYGAIYLDRSIDEAENQPSAFTRDNLRVLVSMARQVGLALDNQAFIRKLVEQERFSAVGEVTSVISHRVNNVLQVINGGSFLVDQGIEKEDLAMIQKGWGIVKANQARITRLTSNLLAYSRPFEPYPSKCKVASLIKEAIENLKETYDTDRILIQYQSDEMEVSVDAYFTSRSIENLLVLALVATRSRDQINSIKATFSMIKDQLKCELRFQPNETEYSVEHLHSPPIDKVKAEMGALELAVAKSHIESQGGLLEIASEGEFCVLIMSLPRFPGAN